VNGLRQRNSRLTDVAQPSGGIALETTAQKSTLDFTALLATGK